MINCCCCCVVVEVVVEFTLNILDVYRFSKRVDDDADVGIATATAPPAAAADAATVG